LTAPAGALSTSGNPYREPATMAPDVPARMYRSSPWALSSLPTLTCYPPLSSADYFSRTLTTKRH
jgi:hypothetical protein